MFYVRACFYGVRVAQALVFCVVFCRPSFVLFLLTIVLYVLLLTTYSDYLFRIFRLVLCQFLYDGIELNLFVICEYIDA